MTSTPPPTPHHPQQTPHGAGGTLRGLRRRVLDGETITGTFVSIGAPSAVEMIALAGFELVCLDAEHAPFGLGELTAMLCAAERRSAETLVRVPEVGIVVSQVLDAGAGGVLIPRVETPEQAAEAVALARYPHEGRRGAGPARASGYGTHLDRTLAEANGTVAVLAQVETRAGVEHAAQIAATPGLDGIFVGPGDLAVSLGVAPGSSTHRAAVEHALAAARGAGGRTGIFVGDTDDIPGYRRLGATVLLVQSDATFLQVQARKAHAAATAACHDAPGARDGRATAAAPVQ